MTAVEQNKKQPIPSIAFIRGVSAIGIIIYHFLGSSRSGIEFMHNYANGTWGNTYVTVFFVISGFVLFYNNPEVTSLKSFYFKRFKSIFPMFWIAYAYFYIEGVFYTGDLFYHDQPWCLIFSVLGVDGYLDGIIPTYYYIGEWFLGAIIILYAIYPLLSVCNKKSAPATAAAVVALFILMYRFNLYTGYPFRAIPSCLLSFEIGILIAKYKGKVLDNNIVLIISCAVVIAQLVIPGMTKYVNGYVLNQLFGWCMFLVLHRIGKIVMNHRAGATVFGSAGALSYPIFLLQHQIIDRMMGYQNYSSKVPTLIMLFFTILFIIVSAWVLDTVTKAAIKLFSGHNMQGLVI